MGAMTFESIDITKVRDGVYMGECNLFPVTAIVKVKVEGGRVIEAQSLEVDAVSGASGSSKAMRKVIENALRKGL